MVMRSELAKRRQEKAGKFLRARAPMTPAEIAVMMVIEAARKHGAALSAAIAAKAARDSKASGLWRITYERQLHLLEVTSTLYKEIGVPHGNIDQEAHALRGRISRAQVEGSKTSEARGDVARGHEPGD